MESLITTLKDKLAKTAGGSLEALVNARKAIRKTFLLIDCSGSMSNYVSLEMSLTKMDSLRQIVEQLRRDGMNNPMVGFGLNRHYGNEAVGFIDRIPPAVGGTPLTEAIQFAQTHGAGHLVVVSDGQPDDPHTAMLAAQAFGGPIDVFYVGPPGDAGEQFLAKLATATRGKCQQVSLGNQKQLSAGLRLMLTA